MKLLAKLLFLWIALTAFIFAVESFIFSGNGHDRFNVDGIKVDGVVIRKVPEHHETIVYSYTVDGRAFESTGPAGLGTPPFNVIQPGTTIVVYYDPNNPQNSIPGEPALYASRNSGHPYFLTIVGPLLIIWGLCKRGWV